MENLINKRFHSFSYTCRYTGVPYYYDKLIGREVFGIGQQMKKDTDWVAHKVQESDTLHSLALKYYNNPIYWWIIASFNDILDATIPLYKQFTQIKIPSFSSIEFENER